MNSTRIQTHASYQRILISLPYTQFVPALGYVQQATIPMYNRQMYSVCDKITSYSYMCLNIRMHFVCGSCYRTLTRPQHYVDCTYIGRLLVNPGISGRTTSIGAMAVGTEQGFWGRKLNQEWLEWSKVTFSFGFWKGVGRF